MSGSMFLGRVLLPGIGLVLAGTLAWQTLRGGTAELRLPFALASLTGGARVDPPGSPGPALPESRKPEDPPIILAEGHVAACPGAEVVVGAELAGTITRVLVQEKSVVHKGDMLIELRGDEIRASAEEAVARVNEADAELTLIEQDQARVNRLPEKQPGQAEARDRIKARWAAAKARRAAAVAGYRRVEAEFARTRVRSPIDGVVVVPHREPRRDRQPGHSPAPDRRPESAADRGRDRRVRHPPLRAGQSRHDHRPGSLRPILARHRRGDRRFPHSPPDPPRGSRPPHRHPRPARTDLAATTCTAEARSAGRGEDRGSPESKGQPAPH